MGTNRLPRVSYGRLWTSIDPCLASIGVHGSSADFCGSPMVLKRVSHGLAMGLSLAAHGSPMGAP